MSCLQTAWPRDTDIIHSVTNTAVGVELDSLMAGPERKKSTPSQEQHWESSPHPLHDVLDS